MGALIVYDPTVPRRAMHGLLAERAGRLDGRPVGLLWNGKANGDEYLRAVKRLLLADDPGLRFVERTKPLASRAMDAAILEDLLTCGAVVNALGD